MPKTTETQTQTQTANDNVVRLLPEPTTANDALAEALARGLTSALILGYTPEGMLYIRSSSDVTRKDALWLIEVARANILGFDDE